MESNNKYLVSGSDYSLSELFSTEHRKVVIPDFQRDYCWGNASFGDNKKLDIVSTFIQTLITEQSNGVMILGKIDVYENPKNLIYLTDGQQRLTTLFLLMGALHRKITDTELKTRVRRCLLSDFEENKDDKEPYLQYAIRDSSVFFMRDLVVEYFLSETKIDVSKIDKQPWFFTEYGIDPTIIAINEALKTIENELKTVTDIDSFARFVIEDVKIQYHDVVDRKHGEERFVIINTTGMSLSPTENVKPILLGAVENKTLSNQWEARETFFWKNKKEKEQIADQGVNDFLTWCFQIIEKQDDVDIIKQSKEYFKDKKAEDILRETNLLFGALEKLINILNTNPLVHKQFEYVFEEESYKTIVELRDGNKDAQKFVLLPLLSFIRKFGVESDLFLLFVRRLRKNYCIYWWEEKNYIDWRYVLQIIETSKTPKECIEFENNFTKISSIELPSVDWYDADEKLKAKLKIIHKEEVETWEDYEDFMGDLSFFGSIDSSLNFEDIDKVYEQFDLFYKNYKTVLEPIKRNNTSHPKLVNLSRLFYLYSDCSSIGHIGYVNWTINGVAFSTTSRNHLANSDFKELLKQKTENLIEYMQHYCIQKAKEEKVWDVTKTNFEAIKFVKCWLILKVLNANENNACIAFYNGQRTSDATGIAAHHKADDNKILTSYPFSLGNSLCGFAVMRRDYLSYASSDDVWLKPHVLDTPFAGVVLNDKKRTKEQIDLNESRINDLINKYLK